MFEYEPLMSSLVVKFDVTRYVWKPAKPKTLEKTFDFFTEQLVKVLNMKKK